MASWRRPKRLRNAGIDDIDRILGWEIDWPERLDYLEILAERVEDVAHDRPPIGYRVALDCLVVVSDRARSPDHVGRGLTAAGAAARRMGRFDEATALYERAGPLVIENRSRGRLLLSRAMLAMHSGRFDLATRLADAGERLVEDPEDRAIAIVVRGNIEAQRAYDTADYSGMHHALALLAEGTVKAEVGGRTQLAGLTTVAGILDLMGIRYFVQAAETLSTLENLLKGRSSRGSRQNRAWIDWIYGKMAYRCGSPKAGRRTLVRAARRLADLGLMVDSVRVAVDLVEMEATWGDWPRGVETGVEILANMDWADVAPIRQRFDRLADTDPNAAGAQIGALRSLIDVMATKRLGRVRLSRLDRLWGKRRNGRWT